VPHLSRRIVGPDHRALLPLSALFGALLLVAADTIARVPLGEQVPVGVITSLVGAPFFCYLLRRRNRETG
jgi:iron complex transport system permease protein